MSGKDSIVTIIVHGTFAKSESWWRRGQEDGIPFADQLEGALAARGLKNTVWDPVLNHGFSYEDFSWSGENRHADRVKGAKAFCKKLAALGKKMGATVENPLSLNLVAHSHGGNVCLEILRYLPRTVQLNKMVTLGTPLVTARPAARLIRFVIAALVFLALMVVPLKLVSSGFDILTSDFQYFLLGHPDDVINAELTGGSACEFKATMSDASREGYEADELDVIPVLEQAKSVEEKAKCELKKESWWLLWLLVLYAPLLSFFCTVFDLFAQVFVIGILRLKNFARGLLSHIFKSMPLGRSSYKAYGPSDAALERIVGTGQLLAVTSHLDEAELMLEVGTAPARLYDEFVQGMRSRMKRILERLFLKGLVSGLILKGVEALFERISLGMPFWRVMWFNYEVDHPGNGRNYYPEEYMQSIRLKLEVEASPLSLAMTRNRAEVLQTQNVDVDVDEGDLRLSLKEVIDDLKQQIKLRHSSYYSSPEVMNVISDFIAGINSEAVEPESAAQ